MSNEYPVLYSPKALEDLRSIYVYVANELKEPEIALKLVKKIREDNNAYFVLQAKCS